MEDKVKAVKTYCEAILESVNEFENSQTNGVIVMHNVKDYSKWMLDLAGEVIDSNLPPAPYKKDRADSK